VVTKGGGRGSDSSSDSTWMKADVIAAVIGTVLTFISVAFVLRWPPFGSPVSSSNASGSSGSQGSTAPGLSTPLGPTVDEVPSRSGSDDRRRFWIQTVVTALPGVAAVAALIFASLSLNATNNQLRITEQRQITDRLNAAVSNLASGNSVIQLGGIYGLQSIMQDSPRDQPIVINILSAYVRYHAPIPPNISFNTLSSVSSNVQAALTVLGRRNPNNDGRAIVDLQGTDLYSANLQFLNLSRANLSGAILIKALLLSTNLSLADLSGASLIHTNLSFVNLSGAFMQSADLSYAELDSNQLGCAKPFIITPGLGITPSLKGCIDLVSASLKGATIFETNFGGAVMEHSDLTNARFSCVNMSDAFLGGATMAGAHLDGVDLTNTDLGTVNVTDADLINVRGFNAAFFGVNLKKLKHPPESQPDHQCASMPRQP
jgi:uncharacterized protein YjbI with pentapeptide repeats